MIPAEIARVGAGFDEHGIKWGNAPAEPHRCSFVAQEGDSLIGYASAISDGNGTWWRVTDLFVEKSRRRRGVGRALLSSLERRISAEGGEWMWSWISALQAPIYFGTLVFETFCELNDWHPSGASRLGVRRALGSGDTGHGSVGPAIRIIERERSETEANQIKAGMIAHARENGEASTERNHYTFVALAGDTFVGCASGYTDGNGRWLYLDNLFIEKPHRGCGVGRELLSALEKKAAAGGVRRIWTWTAGYEAPGFYRRLGYMVLCELTGSFPSGHSRVGFWKVLPVRP